jgi:hypothetical protein
VSDEIGTEHVTAISRRLILPGLESVYGTNPLFFTMRSPEEIAAARAKREAEWDAKTAQGLVGITMDLCCDCGSGEWEKVERADGWVEKWVPAATWQSFVSVRAMLEKVGEALDSELTS